MISASSLQNGDLVKVKEPLGIGKVDGGIYQPVSTRQSPGQGIQTLLTVHLVDGDAWTVGTIHIPLEAIEFAVKTEEELISKILGEDYL